MLSLSLEKSEGLNAKGGLNSEGRNTALSHVLRERAVFCYEAADWTTYSPFYIPFTPDSVPLFRPNLVLCCVLSLALWSH